MSKEEQNLGIIYLLKSELSLIYCEKSRSFLFSPQIHTFLGRPGSAHKSHLAMWVCTASHYSRRNWLGVHAFLLCPLALLAHCHEMSVSQTVSAPSLWAQSETREKPTVWSRAKAAKLLTRMIVIDAVIVHLRDPRAACCCSRS